MNNDNKDNSNNKYIITVVLLLIFVGMFIYFIFIKDDANINSGVGNTFNSISNVLDLNTENNKNSNDNTNDFTNSINDVEKETIISTFSTEIKDDSPGRVTNIGITCGLLNGTIIKPDETFSFNEIVGQPTSDRGYEEATVIVDGEHEDGIGGGNCQVSSTLYNAALLASNLTIVERHEHGGSGVTYVPPKQDAAVSYASNLDFKFKNENPYKIKINIGTDGNKITAEIVKIND